MPTLNYSTSVPVSRTVAEMQQALAGHGAASVSIAYDAGRPSGLAFMLQTPHGSRHFALPVDVAAVQRLLTSQRKGRDGYQPNSRVDARPGTG